MPIRLARSMYEEKLNFEYHDRGKMIGSADVEIRQKGGEDRRRAEILDFEIHKDMRGKGFGTRFCAELEKYLLRQKVESVCLYTSDGTDRFWRKSGYSFEHQNGSTVVLGKRLKVAKK